MLKKCKCFGGSFSHPASCWVIQRKMGQPRLSGTLPQTSDTNGEQGPEEKLYAVSKTTPCNLSLPLSLDGLTCPFP